MAVQSPGLWRSISMRGVFGLSMVGIVAQECWLCHVAGRRGGAILVIAGRKTPAFFLYVGFWSLE